MIVPMKKITVLSTEAQKENTLKALRDLGVMHIISLKTPSGASLNLAKDEMNTAQKALDALPAKAKKESVVTGSSKALFQELKSLLAQKKELEEENAAIKSDLNRFSIYGDLDPQQIKSLENQGIFISLYEAEKSQKPSFEGEAVLHYFGKDSYGEKYAVINRGESAVQVNATKLSLPSQALSTLRTRLSSQEELLSKIESRLTQIASAKSLLKEELLNKVDDFNFEEVSAGTFSDSGISMVQGFCPVPRLHELEALAPKLGLGLKVEDPSEEEQVPTLLEYNKLSSPMKFLYDIIGISPGYNEMDVSLVFLAFFSIFFAMIVGDAAYGLLFLALTLFAQAKLPKAPKAAFHFMILMSVSTFIWGFFNNSFFGFSPEVLDITQKSFVPGFLKSFANWIRVDTSVQYLCFILGVSHLTIAHLWNFVIKLKRKCTTAIAQIGWLFSTWFMFFLASNMVLDKEIPAFATPLFIVGLVLVVLFMVPPRDIKKEWISFPMLIFDVVNNFVDIISYIRLFAVGMAGVAIAEAFNGMLSPLFGSVVGIAVSVLALFFVHALNIALSIMGVAVHALRLNTLEFSSHLDLQWSGTEFKPFAKENTNA